jgi:hypothetical protein
MRTIITTLLLLISTTLFSQEIEVIKEKIKINDGIQKGNLIYNGTKYVQNGIWKSDYAKAKYDMGKLVWYELKGGKRYTYSYIRMEQLRRKVQRLETRLASNDKP